MQYLICKKAFFGLLQFNMQAFLAVNQIFTPICVLCINIPCDLLI